MNQFTGYELLWLFLIYSFLGWVLETVIATVRQRKVVNRGLINGPFCIIYGIGAVLITIWLQELSGLWLFLFSAVYASVVESTLLQQMLTRLFVSCMINPEVPRLTIFFAYPMHSEISSFLRK